MSDTFPRPPADDAEREACDALPGSDSCDKFSPDGHRCVVAPQRHEPPIHDGDHIAARGGKVLARWPQAPAAEPAAVVPLSAARVVAEARRICALAEKQGKTSAEIVTLACELRSMDAGMAGGPAPTLRGRVHHRFDDGGMSVAIVGDAYGREGGQRFVHLSAAESAGLSVGDKVTVMVSSVVEEGC